MAKDGKKQGAPEDAVVYSKATRIALEKAAKLLCHLHWLHGWLTGAQVAHYGTRIDTPLSHAAAALAILEGTDEQDKPTDGDKQNKSREAVTGGAG